MNLNKDLGKTGTQMTLFSQEVFLASHTQPPGSDLEKKMNATCGPKCVDSFGRFNRNGLWAKTFSALLIGQEGWFSKRCRLTWKVKGTKYNRMYFQLRASTTLPTNEIGFGLLHSELLPTPESFDWNSARHPELWERDKKKYAEKGINLHCNLRQMARLSMLPTPISSEIHHAERVKKLKESGAETMASRKLGASRPNGLMDFLDFNQMLPTPTTQDARIGENNIGGSKHRMERGSVALADIAFGFNNQMLPTPNCMDTLPPKEGAAMERIANGARKGRTAPSNLREYVNPKSWEAYQMLPTPASRDYKGARSTEALEASGRTATNSLPDSFSQTGKTSQLNPLFVGEMMGFPPNWLELPFQNTETNP